MNSSSTCRSCGAEIIWATTPIGRRMPLENADFGKGNVHLESIGGELIAKVGPVGSGRYVSHFTTCPQADDWRRG